MRYRLATLTFILLWLLVPIVAGDTPKENAQKDAEALLERARELSDIRNEKASPFRLRANFSLVGDNLDTFEGSYTEMWASDSQWRREIVIGDWKRIEVGTPNRLWKLDNAKGMPNEASRVPGAIAILPARSAKFEFESIQRSDNATLCAVTKPVGERKAKHAFCFDQKDGVLVENIAPEFLRQHVADYSCGYDDFRKFGNQFFPYNIDCRLDKHKKLEVHVVDLTREAFTGASLFAPPDGAIEIGRCAAFASSPKPLYTPNPIFPAGERGQIGIVGIRFVIDNKGKTENIEISRSAGKAFDDNAASAVRNWRFKPATCNGEAMPTQMEIELNMHYRF